VGGGARANWSGACSVLFVSYPTVGWVCLNYRGSGGIRQGPHSIGPSDNNGTEDGILSQARWNLNVRQFAIRLLLMPITFPQDLIDASGVFLVFEFL